MGSPPGLFSITISYKNFVKYKFTLSRSLNYIFDTMKEIDSIKSIKMTFVELYNNNFRDLLDFSANSNSKKQVISIHENKTGVFLSGSDTIETSVSNIEEALSLLNK